MIYNANNKLNGVLIAKTQKKQKDLVCLQQRLNLRKSGRKIRSSFFARKTCVTEEGGATAPEGVTAVLLAKTDAVLDMFMTFLV